MSKTVEEPVTKEAPAIGRDAFAAARASLADQSSDQDPDTDTPASPDDTPTEPPAEEPETVADQPTETTSEPDTILSPEQLAALSPKERANAEKWQAKLTQKAQALSAKERELDEWKPLIESMKENPDDVIAEYARARGFTISRQAQDTQTVSTEATEVIAGLPEDLKFLGPILKPMFERYGQTIIQSVEAKVNPIAQAHNLMMTEAAAAQTQATLESFTTKHPEWQQHEPAMVELAKKFIPTPGSSMTDAEYMDTLYALVTAKQSKADLVKATVKQINKSAASVEPNTPGVSESRVEHAMPANFAQMDNKDRMKAAFDAAKAGIVWKK
jgi:hypothetical protein